MDSEDGSEAANQRAFALRRAMVEHEDRQIESRLSALLIANSFMLTAVVILLANAYNSRDPDSFFASALVIAVVAILMAVLTEYGIVGARLVQWRVSSAEGPFELTMPFAGARATAWRSCLHPEDSSRFRGSFYSAHWFAKATTLAWLGLVHHCLKYLASAELAMPATIALFFVCFAILFAIYLCHRPGGPRSAD